MTEKPVRIKLIRRQEERAQKVKGLWDMWKLDSPASSSSNTYQYQPLGGSVDLEAYKDQKIKGLFQMFHLA